MAFNSITVLSAATLGATTSTVPLGTSDFKDVSVFIVAAAKSGSPSFTPTLQTSVDGTNWVTLSPTPAAITANGVSGFIGGASTKDALGNFARVVLTFSGSGSFAFTVTLVAK